MHIPVLLKEVLEFLNPKPNENFVDCTFGFGGHSEAILEKIKPHGKVLGIEWDNEKLKIKNEKLKIEQGLILVNDSYANLKDIIKREKLGPINGILLDLGLSSWEIENSGKGFSFQKDEPLDMRYAVQSSKCKVKSLTAREIINEWGEEDLARIFQEYGQERFAKNIARNIVEVRLQQPIETTFQLVDIIRKSFPRSYKFGKAHFATRVFQALRIAVNSELDNLKAVLPQALEVLEKNGRIAVIAFHSLEDAIVKKFFKEQAKSNTLQILTKKPIMASREEIKQNPKSRSAKLRVAIKS
ncbi:MAG: 16S rRNA (cytosine(1402)-N(4))-methyltransferase RsmH [bacterium]|nr:16S rRNA (cytosine(1402)-N(4))-methyltransferase RsmH [bacterium]